MGATALVVLLVLAAGAGTTPEPKRPRSYLDVIARHPSELGEGGQVIEFLGEDAVVKVAPDSHCPGKMNVGVQSVRRGAGSCARSMRRITRELTDLFGEPHPSDSTSVPTFSGNDVEWIVAVWAVEHGTVTATCIGTPEEPGRKTTRSRLSVTRKWRSMSKLPTGDWQRKYLGRGGDVLQGCAE